MKISDLIEENTVLTWDEPRPGTRLLGGKTMTSIKTHHLKTWPKYFQLVRSGHKTFELRIDDRDFQVGDKLTLQEWLPTQRRYTGVEIYAEITHILSLKDYSDMKGWRWSICRRLMPNFVIMSIKVNPNNNNEVNK